MFSYHLTYKRNLMNKIKKQANQVQRHGNREQMDSCQRKEGRESVGEKGKGLVKEYV